MFINNSGITNINQIGTRLHNDLQGLTVGDPHTQYIKDTGQSGMTGTYDFTGATEFKVLDPVNAADAASKSYVDAHTANIKFGGTGVDGALTITSGTTTIDLAGARTVVKNYSSISITGTGKLAFINPHANGSLIVIKCLGAATLSSSATPMIDISNCGAAGSVGAVETVSGTVNSLAASSSFWGTTNFPGAAASSSSTPATPSLVLPTTFDQMMYEKWSFLVIGSGGSGGAALNIASGYTTTGGDGGRGAGALVLQVGGTLTFTTAGGLSTSGTPGGNGQCNSGASCNAGGGGPGGCGSVILLYNTAGTITGTITNVSAAVGVGLYQPASAGACKAGNSGAGLTAGGVGTSAQPGIVSAAGIGLAVMALNTEYA